MNKSTAGRDPDFEGCGLSDFEEDSQDINDEDGSDQNKLLKQARWEKNVRRRVYDALNVLYAAGVLQK